ncbi:hypothetical protein KAR28_06080 [Candidatus Parcubacteria bacterium]|nr:hypothetical protein [Candidatus Parcubacteria bacterium]
MPGRKKKKIKQQGLLAQTNKELMAEKKSVKTMSGKKAKISKVKPEKRISIRNKVLNRKIRKPARTKKKQEKLQADSRMEARLDKEKQLIIFSGVTFFMVLIAFFWIFNISQVFKKMSVANENENNNDMADTWQELSEGLGNSLDQMRFNLEKVDELKDNLMVEQYTSTTIERLPENDPEPVVEQEITEEQVEKLKEILEEN